jgi:hypothetical protein
MASDTWAMADHGKRWDADRSVLLDELPPESQLAPFC